MQTLDLDEGKATEHRKKFWRRQFQQEPTKAQRKFDWIFGVVMPVTCIFLDPVFFSTHNESQPIWGAFKPFVYLLSFTAILAMMAWLIWGSRLKWLNALLGGLFLAGAVVAFAVGVFMLPYSLIGLIILIGALGFTPLLTGIVYLRNGARAIGAAELFLVRKTLVYTVLLSALASGVIPYVISAEINRHFPQSRSTVPNLFQY